MPTKLERTFRRKIDIDGQPFTVTVSPEGLTFTPKSRRHHHQFAPWTSVLNTGAQLTSLNSWARGERRVDQRPLVARLFQQGRVLYWRNLHTPIARREADVVLYVLQPRYSVPRTTFETVRDAVSSKIPILRVRHVEPLQHRANVGLFVDLIVENMGMSKKAEGIRPADPKDAKHRAQVAVQAYKDLTQYCAAFGLKFPKRRLRDWDVFVAKYIGRMF